MRPLIYMVIVGMNCAGMSFTGFKSQPVTRSAGGWALGRPIRRRCYCSVIAWTVSCPIVTGFTVPL